MLKHIQESGKISIPRFSTRESHGEMMIKLLSYINDEHLISQPHGLCHSSPAQPVSQCMLYPALSHVDAWHCIQSFVGFQHAQVESEYQPLSHFNDTYSIRIILCNLLVFSFCYPSLLSSFEIVNSDFNSFWSLNSKVFTALP
jgi:hypothetical protein